MFFKLFGVHNQPVVDHASGLKICKEKLHKLKELVFISAPPILKVQNQQIRTLMIRTNLIRTVLSRTLQTVRQTLTVRQAALKKNRRAKSPRQNMGRRKKKQKSRARTRTKKKRRRRKAKRQRKGKTKTKIHIFCFLSFNNINKSNFL